MKLKITQEFFYEIDPKWYPIANNESIQDRIIDFEKREITEGILGWDRLEKGETKIEIIDS
jgi:hypothetical protein